MSKTNKKKEVTKIYLTRESMRDALSEMDEDISNEIKQCEELVDLCVDAKDINGASRYIVKHYILRAIYKMIYSGQLIISIDGDEYPIIYLYRILQEKHNE